MDTAQWPQDILVRPMEEIVATNKPPSVERKVRPQKEQALNCPRCNSTNTKFCYYNNYSLSQPRYFCKTCRRYWTEGGSLRNIPVGGGSRKNKRPSTNSLISNSSKKLPDLVPPPQQNPKINDTTQDLNLGIYSNTPHHQFINQLPNFDHNGTEEIQINPSCSSPSALELLTGIKSTTRSLSSFIQMNNDPNTSHVYNNSSSTGFPLPEFRHSLIFSLDGLGSNYGGFQGVQESSGKHLLFPFEDLKQDVPSSNNNNNANDGHNQQNGEQNAGPDSTGYWNGVIGGGSW